MSYFHGVPDERERAEEAQLEGGQALPPPSPHAALLGLEDEALLALAPDATHQHYKGGLYRLLGEPTDSVTGMQLMYGRLGDSVVIYEHVYPYGRQLWARPRGEFRTVIREEGGVSLYRFRELKRPEEDRPLPPSR